MNKDIKSAILALSVVFLLLVLWSNITYFGLLFSASLLAVGSFLACRSQGWMVIFAIPISFSFLLLGFEDGSFNLQSNQLFTFTITSIIFLLSIVIILISAITGSIIWYRRGNKLLNHGKNT